MDNLTYDKDLHIFLDAEGNPATQEDILLWGAENPVVTFQIGMGLNEYPHPQQNQDDSWS